MFPLPFIPSRQGRGVSGFTLSAIPPSAGTYGWPWRDRQKLIAGRLKTLKALFYCADNYTRPNLFGLV
jgi:hypothetical protein